MEELIKKLNDLKIVQKSYDFRECIPEEIWNEYFDGLHSTIKSGIDPDEHRWYETSITVLAMSGPEWGTQNLLGIRLVSKIFSESMNYEDCFYWLRFYPMKEVKTVTYKVVPETTKQTKP